MHTLFARSARSCTAPFASAALLLSLTAGSSAAQNYALEQELFGPASRNVEFGRAVVVDGATAVVGAPRDSGSGSVSVYLRTGGVWALQQRLTEAEPSGALYGFSVDVDGDTLVVGAPQLGVGSAPPGKAFVYVRAGGTWTYTMHGPDGAGYPNRFVFLQIEAPRLLRYDHDTGGEGNPDLKFIGEIELTDEGGKTRIEMRLTVKNFETRDAIAGRPACRR